MKKPSTKMQPAKTKATEPDQELDQVMAATSIDQIQASNAYHPAMRAFAGGQTFTKEISGELDMFASISVLVEQIKEVKSGNLGCAEATLTAQANTLDLIFNSLAKKAAKAGTLNHYETFLRLALKAQSQCRTTYETLAEIKSPRPMAFIKQQNIGMNQQVNNGTAPRAHEKSINLSNELLESQHGERLDTGTTGTTIGTDKELETLGAINRSKDARR